MSTNQVIITITDGTTTTRLARTYRDTSPADIAQRVTQVQHLLITWESTPEVIRYAEQLDVAHGLLSVYNVNRITGATIGFSRHNSTDSIVMANRAPANAVTTTDGTILVTVNMATGQWSMGELDESGTRLRAAGEQVAGRDAVALSGNHAMSQAVASQVAGNAVR